MLEIYSAKCKFEYDIETPKFLSKKKNVKHHEWVIDLLEDRGLKQIDPDDRVWFCVADSENDAVTKICKDSKKIEYLMWHKVHWSIDIFRPSGLQITNIRFLSIDPYIAKGITYNDLKMMVPVDDFVKYYNEKSKAELK